MMTEDREKELLAIVLEYVEKYGLTSRARAFFRNAETSSVDPKREDGSGLPNEST